MTKLLPLFPLPLVIFPGSQYPLHIFEPRYKTLIRETLKSDTGFGIVATIDNKISDISTYVKLIKVIKKYSNGESDIIIEGKQRYFINEVMIHPVGYLVADVKLYEDNTDSVNKDLEVQLLILFDELLKRIKYDLTDEYWNNLRESKWKTFKIAEKAGLTIEQQQQLLTIQSENERIKYLIKHFENVEKRYSEDETLKSLIMYDGFLNEKKDN